jgi:hypothetical protein
MYENFHYVINTRYEYPQATSDGFAQVKCYIEIEVTPFSGTLTSKENKDKPAITATTAFSLVSTVTIKGVETC